MLRWPSLEGVKDRLLGVVDLLIHLGQLQEQPVQGVEDRVDAVDQAALPAASI
ncbi:MAG: hypothetical protein ACYDAL_02355 [Candidatus Dormibacteraceae bacterium]